MNFNKLVLPILLLLFWIFLAYRALSRGDTSRAGVYLVIGIALTIWRVKRARG